MTGTARVVQWTTGNVGKSSVKAIAASPAASVPPSTWMVCAGDVLGQVRREEPAAPAISSTCSAQPDPSAPMWMDVDARPHPRRGEPWCPR